MDEDVILMQRVSEGDLEAFSELIKKYQRRIYTFFLRSTGSVEDAEDLTQTLFVKLYKSAENYRPASSFNTYIYSIASNLAVSFARKNKRKRSSSIQDMSAGRGHLEDRDHHSNPSTRVERGELLDSYVEALDKLPPEWKTAIELKVGRELSYREIADVLGKSVSAVESILFRARRRLADELSMFMEEEDD